jgi:hypothetical protein
MHLLGATGLVLMQAVLSRQWIPFGCEYAWGRLFCGATLSLCFFSAQVAASGVFEMR